MLLGTLDEDASRPRLVLRPLSVQERIRELNLRARHFAETILAVQLQTGNGTGIPPARRAIQARSLTTSPTRQLGCDPEFLLQPIDINDLGSSRCSSIENLEVVIDSASGPIPHAIDNYSNSLPRSFRNRWSRRSQKSLNRSDSETKESESESERLLEERESELRKRLQGFEDGTTKVLTPYEAKSLVALLHAKDPDVLERALITVSNSAAFTANQDNLRDAGCIYRLQALLRHEDAKVKSAALTAVSNMALNVANQKQMGNVIPTLSPLLSEEDDKNVLLQVLLTLTNVTALNDWHDQLRWDLDKVLDLALNGECDKIRIQALKLLVNLSTNEKMIPHLIKAKATKCILGMLDDDSDSEKLLRVVTFLSNVICSAQKRLNDNRLKLNQSELDSM